MESPEAKWALGPPINDERFFCRTAAPGCPTVGRVLRAEDVGRRPPYFLVPKLSLEAIFRSQVQLGNELENSPKSPFFKGGLSYRFQPLPPFNKGGVGGIYKRFGLEKATY